MTEIIKIPEMTEIIDIKDNEIRKLKIELEGAQAELEIFKDLFYYVIDEFVNYKKNQHMAFLLRKKEEEEKTNIIDNIIHDNDRKLI